ncbi:MAG: type II secretion system F family protein [Verrucomicrobiales bacterium]|nr:type II secretion system F family protein [Verrucomicrobiae bacterium]MCP5553587.1 type II secretion system F family protein [Akkermansiaceae bacterium]
MSVPTASPSQPQTAGPQSAVPAGKKTGSLKKFPRQELVKFSRAMASMLKARINTSDALKYYGQDHPSADVRQVTSQIRTHIDMGAPAFVAFAKTGRFDDKFISLIRAGSDTGQLDKAFAAIAHRLKKEAEFASKLKKATLLPCIVISILIGLFIVAQLKITPQVEKMLKDVRQEPDQFSKVMFTISHVIQITWPFIIIGIVTFAVCVVKIQPVRDFVLNFLMAKWRLLRQLVMGMRQMAFLGTMNMLYANGVTLARSISIAAEGLKKTPLYDELMEAGAKYHQTGLPFSEAIRKYTSCDGQVAHMISIGERSSSLDVQLQLLTEMYEEETDEMVAQFTGAVNILSLLIACVLISCVFIGAFLPIFMMGPKMMNGSGM